MEGRLGEEVVTLNIKLYSKTVLLMLNCTLNSFRIVMGKSYWEKD